MKVIHCIPEMRSDEPRVLEARQTWQELYSHYDWIPAPLPEPYPRSSLAFGDARNCAFWRDIIKHGLRAATSEEDVLVITDADVILCPGLDAAVREIAVRCELFSGQKIDVDSKADICPFSTPEVTHVGRSLVGARAGWFIQHEIPDFIFGPSTADLCLAAWSRKLVGKTWTMANAGTFEPACEIEPGEIYHVRHKSSWVDIQETAPGDRYNRRITARWFRRNLPHSCPKHLRHLT